MPAFWQAMALMEEENKRYNGRTEESRDILYWKSDQTTEEEQQTKAEKIKYRERAVWENKLVCCRWKSN